MGLATVHGIVHEHSGHVVVDNVPGRGARFRIVFPPLQADKTGAVTTTASREGSAPPRHALHGRVLVVDDEETVAEFMRDLLESWGVEVTSASTASEARERVARDPQAYDVVITDQTMPRMTGLELARELLAIRRDLPVILYTGYGEGIAQEKTAAAGICALLKKPVEPQALFALLKAHLRSPRPSPAEKVTGTDG
jgi:CheY-like chemotaxis protein